MADDQLSSSELRKRYLQGGLDDDQMSASQLRAKAGIPHNSKNWSTKQGQDDSTLLIIGAVVFVLALGLFAYFSVSD